MPDLHSNLHQNHFENPDQLNQTLAAFITEKLEAAIIEKGSAAFAVSGGRTPAKLFETLSNTPIDWSSVTITLADERWVDEVSDASNARLVKQYLLQNLAAEATFLPLKNKAATAKEGESLLEEELQSIGPMDVLILGMGTDGHTASLFPCSAELTQALDLNNPKCCQSVTPTTAPHERMTMTFQWLLKSQSTILHIVGADKLAVLESALNAENKPPIGLVIEQSAEAVELFYAP